MNPVSIIRSNPLRRCLPLLVVALLCMLVVEPVLVGHGTSSAFAQNGKKGKKPAAKRNTQKKRTEKKQTEKKRSTKSKGSSSRSLAGGKKKGSPSNRQSSIVNRTSPAPARIKVPIALEVLPDSMHVEELAEGISYRWIKTTGDQIAHVVTIDLKSGARLRSYKAHDRCDGLQNACDIASCAAESMADTVVVATNASFWRAGSNTPIGPTITDGEVIEMPGYKQWSSMMIYDDGSAAFDRVTLRGQLFWKARRFTVAGVNRRENSPGVVVYNRYYGDSLPLGSRKSDSAIVAEAYANKVGAEIGDNTEGNGIDTAEVIRAYREGKVQEHQEYPLLKLAVVPIPPRRKRDPMPRPIVGDTMRLIVREIDTGVVAVPENGYVISLGDAAEWFSIVQAGDTVGLLYSITPAQTKRVRDMLTGTPRLVRNGVADPEHEIEGSKARRFVDGKLARTAVGISAGGDTLILATINSPNSTDETTGMSLAQLAAFMKSLGAYQAMNFDGGGSASMALNGVMVSRQGSRPTTRRVSNAIIATKPAKKVRSAQRALAPQ